MPGGVLGALISGANARRRQQSQDLSDINEMYERHRSKQLLNSYIHEVGIESPTPEKVQAWMTRNNLDWTTAGNIIKMGKGFKEYFDAYKPKPTKSTKYFKVGDAGIPQNINTSGLEKGERIRVDYEDGNPASWKKIGAAPQSKVSKGSKVSLNDIRNSLDEIVPLGVPVNPVTGKPFEYSKDAIEDPTKVLRRKILRMADNIARSSTDNIGAPEAIYRAIEKMRSEQPIPKAPPKTATSKPPKKPFFERWGLTTPSATAEPELEGILPGSPPSEGLIKGAPGTPIPNAKPFNPKDAEPLPPGTPPAPEDILPLSPGGWKQFLPIKEENIGPEKIQASTTPSPPAPEAAPGPKTTIIDHPAGYADNPDFRIGIIAGQGLMVSEDGGSSWAALTPEQTQELANFYQANPNLASQVPPRLMQMLKSRAEMTNTK